VRRILSCCALIVFVIAASGCLGKLGLGPTPQPATVRFAVRDNLVDIKPIVADFHAKYPNITVELVKIERFGTAMDMAIRSGRVDVFREGREALIYQKEGLLKPLDEMTRSEWGGIRDDYYKGTWEALSVQGRQWGIPAGLDMYVVFVNKDHLGALKLPTPAPTWSLFDFLELAKKMNYPNGLPYLQSSNLIGFCSTPQSMDPVIFTYMHGGKIVDNLASPTKATLDDPRNVEAVQWYTELFLRYGVAPDPEMVRTRFTRGGTFEAAARGACGLWLGWFSNRGGLDTPYRWSSGWAMLPMPKDKAEMSLGDMDGYFVTKDCKYPAEALKFVRFLSDRWDASGQKLPPRKALAADKGYAKAVGVETATVAGTFSERVIMIPYNTGPALEQVGGAFVTAVSSVLTDGTDPAKALAAAQRSVSVSFGAP
jgi:ABC-type glycerol-3-phosphate transport system substrate-binding protein